MMLLCVRTHRFSVKRSFLLQSYFPHLLTGERPLLCVCAYVCERVWGVFFVEWCGVCVQKMSSKTPQIRTHTRTHTHNKTPHTRNTTHTHYTKKDAPLPEWTQKPRKRLCYMCFQWASGLGIGFWLRGVQPRTTVRWLRGTCRSTNPRN